MDVWIVWNGYTIVAVFSSEERADAFMVARSHVFEKMRKGIFRVDLYEV